MRSARVLIGPVLMVLLAGCGALDTAREPTPAKAAPKVPAPLLVTMGLAYADATADTRGFDVSDHDAFGRNRRTLNDKDWQVCFQDPRPPVSAADQRVYPQGSTIKLGVVKVTEKCTRTDHGRPRHVNALRELVGRTAHMARQDLGQDASIRFVQRNSNRVISWNLGDWHVCSIRSMNSGERYWHGQPVRIRVAERGKRCSR
jgi:hypothetical protein